MAKQKREVRRRRGRAGIREEEGRGALGVHRAVRGLRLQQEPQRRLRHARLQDRLPEGALPGGVHGGDALLRDGLHRRDRQVHQREPRDGHRDPAARRQRERMDLLGRRRTRSASASARSRASARAPARRCSLPAGPRGASGASPILLLEVDRQAVNQKVFDALVKSGACDSLGGAPRGARRRARRPRRAGSAPTPGDRSRAEQPLRVGQRQHPAEPSRRRRSPPGRRASACGWRRRPSASTSRGIRWSSSRAT